MVDPSSAEHATPREAGKPDVPERSRDLRHTLEQMYGADWTLERDALLADLETAEEELRVADEEILSQQAELARLLRAQQNRAIFEERIISALPVAVVVTDVVGRIRTGNAAVGALLGVPVLNLIGKPLQTYVELEDRRLLRRALTASARDPSPIELSLRLDIRARRIVAGRLFGHPRQDATGRVADIVWVVLLDTADEAGTVDVAAAFSRLVELAVDSDDPKSMLTSLATLCAESLGEDVSVTVTMGSPLQPDAVGSNDQLAQSVDGAIVVTGEGPCQDAWEVKQLVGSDDVRIDDRWPKLAEFVAERGVASAIALPLEGEGDLLGTLNLYSPRPKRFDADEIEIATFLGTSIAAVFRELEQRRQIATLADQLQHALETRPIIEQAKGILMAANRCTAEEAFAMLLNISRRTNVKLREVAAQTVREVSRG